MVGIGGASLASTQGKDDMDIDSDGKIRAGTQALEIRRDGMEIISPFNEDGILSDWDAVEALWDYTLKYVLSSFFKVILRVCSRTIPTSREATGQPCQNKRKSHVDFLSPSVGTSFMLDDSDGCRDQMKLAPEEHPMMLAEASHNDAAAREKMTEIMFEKYNVPAVFIAKNAVLSSFAIGRQTSLVVDAGHKSTVGTSIMLCYIIS